MTTPPTVPVAALLETRQALHRLSAHILGRRRFMVSGRFGLRASPAGIATPAFGSDPEVLRVAGTHLIREIGGTASIVPIVGSSLHELAVFANVDLSDPFDCGAEAPGVGDTDTPIQIDPDAARLLSEWFWLGWKVLDSVISSFEVGGAPAVIQLWPEHFDAGTSVATDGTQRVNLGFSPGDGYEPEPYTYVGPQGPERPDDSEFWNAPFGAVLRWSESRSSPDPSAACERFLRMGLEHMRRRSRGTASGT